MQSKSLAFNAATVFSRGACAISPSKMTDYFNLEPDVISLGLGEPGMPTPDCIGAGGVNAIQSGRTGYTPTRGETELQQEICSYLERLCACRYSCDEVLLTVGASLGIDCVMRAVINAGDEVIVSTPAYGYYETVVVLSGGTLVKAPASQATGWKLTPDVLERAVSPRTKAILLNYPNNPTGAVMQERELAALAEVIRATQAVVISDETYAELTYEGRHHSILAQPGIRERGFLVSGFSKSMAMTGWRLGYLCAPAELLGPAVHIHAASVLCASGIAQAAALEGLKNGRSAIDKMMNTYRDNRDYALRRSRALNWECDASGGAFYLWADISRSGLEAEQFARRLRREKRVAVIPGVVFGEEYRHHLRISYSCPREILKEAFERIEDFCKTL